MELLRGDCLEKMREMDNDSIDAIVTDPPYGWRFMGKAWDGEDIEKMAKQARRPGETYVGKDGVTRSTRDDPAMAAGKYDQSLSANKSFEVWTKSWAEEAFRVLKPGGHMLVFCGPRTYHRMASGVEDAGFEIRDQLQWLFGSGFPKSYNLKDDWKGWGSALKPANEPIVLARKPLGEKTLALNMIKWGTGALNIDGSRINVNPKDPNHRLPSVPYGTATDPIVTNFGSGGRPENNLSAQGRWPANLILDEIAAEMLDEQSGILKSGEMNIESKGFGNSDIFGNGKNIKLTQKASIGGASRFFYCAKTSMAERNRGCEGLPDVYPPADSLTAGIERRNGKVENSRKSKSAVKNNHPTVKPIKLMGYLCKLITPPKGIVLDPFMGSGSTGVSAKNLGFDFIGIEMNEEYFEIAKKRIG